MEDRGGSQRQLREALPSPFTFRDPNLQEMYRVGLNRIAAKEVPIEIKLVNPPILSQLQSKEPKQMFWVRARGHIGKRTPRTGRKHSPGVSACTSYALCGAGHVTSPLWTCFLSCMVGSWLSFSPGPSRPLV